MSETTMEVFGVYGYTVINAEDFMPEKELKVIGDIELPSEHPLIPLEGGAYAYPVDAENGRPSSEATVNIREFPAELFEYLGGAEVTVNAAEAAGATTAIANRKGTSAVAATGLASVGLKSGATANLKSGLYTVKVESATTVKVYAASGQDLKRGTNKITVTSNDNCITSSALTITTGTAVEIPNTGLELTGGAGTIAMVVGDTAFFEVRPANTGSTLITLGSQAAAFKTSSGFFTAKKKATGEIVYIFAPKVKGSGVPFSLKENAWCEGAVKLMLCVDDVLGYAYRITHIKPVSA